MVKVPATALTESAKASADDDLLWPRSRYETRGGKCTIVPVFEINLLRADESTTSENGDNE